MSKGGGKTNSTVTQTNLPEYARPYFESLMERAESESQRPYTPYEGQRLADMSGLTSQSFAGIGGMTESPLYNQAAGQTQDAIQKANLTGSMSPLGRGFFTPAQFSQAGFSRAQFSETPFSEYQYNPVSDFRQEASSFMSPYMQNVVDQQKQRAMLDFERMQAGRDAKAVQAGAFGGSRQAVVDALAQEELSRGLADIQAQGLQSAWQDASSAFESQRAAEMQREAERAAELGRVQGMTAQERARVQGMDAQELARVQAARAAELARVQAGNAQEQARTQGAIADERFRYAGMGLDAAQLQGSLAGQLGALAGDQQRSALELYSAQAVAGKDMEQYDQRKYDLAYEDFLNQQNYGRDLLSFYSSMLRGIPVTPDTQTSMYVQRNPLQDLLGAGLATFGTYKYGTS